MTVTQHDLKSRILAYENVIEPVTSHHVLRSGRHGRLCDMDQIPADSELFWDISAGCVAAIAASTNGSPDMLITVANGGNRFAPAFRTLFSTHVSVRMTVKNPEDRTDIQLTYRTVKALQRTRPKKVCVFDDMGTEGTNAATVARQVLRYCDADVNVYTAAFRRDTHEKLDEIGVEYDGLVRLTDDLPTPTAAECRQREYCARGVVLLAHGS